jgi:hypothetical protein
VKCWQEASKPAQQCRFARAIGTSHDKCLTIGQREGKIFDKNPPAATEREPLGFKPEGRK